METSHVITWITTNAHDDVRFSVVCMWSLHNTQQTWTLSDYTEHSFNIARESSETVFWNQRFVSSLFFTITRELLNHEHILPAYKLV